MTLRDLTPRQLYNLRRKSDKLQREWLSKNNEPNIQLAWNAAFNAGLKSGLAVAGPAPCPPRPVLSNVQAKGQNPKA